MPRERDIMPATWLIGDLHFGHEKVASIRGYRSVEEHDAAIVRKWDRQVAPGDIVHVLGDLSAGGAGGELHALEILQGLPGRKRLVAGNHDSVSGIRREISPRTRFFREVFEQISDHGHVRLNRETIYLSHYPYRSQGDGPGRSGSRFDQYRLPDYGARLVHAHTHHAHPTSGSVTGRELCVSWDAWRRLVNLGDVQKWIDA